MDIPPGLCRNPPADLQAIASCEKSIGKRVPADYREFLAASNGGEGFIGDNFLLLWRMDELVELNEAYAVAEALGDGVLLFGSNGGGEAYGFDCRSGPWTVIQVPFVPMELELVERVAQSFAEFLQSLAGAGS
jgi:cell wall assembly regulator SMI1